MPKVLGLFNSADDLSRAQAALQEAGLGDDIKRIIEGTSGSSSNDASTPPTIAAGSLPGGAVVNRAGRTAPTALNSAVTELGLPEEEREYFASTLEDGAKLLVLETSEADRAEKLLAAAGAQRTHIHK